MWKHFRRVGTSITPLVLVAGFLLTQDIPTVVRQADKSAAEIARAVGFASPPEHMATYVWSHPFLAFIGALLLLALGAGVSWSVEWAFKKRGLPYRLTDESLAGLSRIMSGVSQSSAPLMPLRELVRHVALDTDWGLSYQPTHWPTWQDALKTEILHKLVEGKIPGRGIKHLRDRPEDSAPTPISPEFWAQASFHPEHMMVDNDAGMVWQKGEPCEVLYSDVHFDRAAVDRVWPTISQRKRRGRVSAFAGLASEWHAQQEDARLNRNPGVGFDVAWSENAAKDRLSRTAADQAASVGRKLRRDTGIEEDPDAISDAIERAEERLTVERRRNYKLR